jgi:transcriptional regulator with PAS, ATPase and Fis domain
VLARWLHANSPYAGGEFVKVVRGDSGESAGERTVWAREGAFTGARRETGTSGRAHLGTLFLDEIGDLDPGLQSKLLHFLQDGFFSRLGDQCERVVETRVICATGRKLEDEIAGGRFRADLYYRINVLKIAMPTLADRRGDIPQLAEYFRRQHSQQFDRSCDEFGPEILSYLQNMAWPGNLRELSNCIARYIVVGPDGLVQPEPVRPRKLAKAHNGNNREGMPL